MANGIALIQAYQQAPWRKEIQRVGVLASIVVAVAVVAAGYLSVTAAAARAGRAVQATQAEIRKLNQTNEHLQTQLGVLTSARTMQERAADLGFVPVEPEQLVFVQVPGYGGRPQANLAPAPQAGALFGRQLPREYTLSLFEWMQDTFALLALPGSQP